MNFVASTRVRLCGEVPVDLPNVTMSNGIKIALFDPYDMTNAKQIIMCLKPFFATQKRNFGFETIVVPATKPIPIAWHLALEFNYNLVILKKEVKPYYSPWKSFKCKSITSDNENEMYITTSDFNKLYHKKVIFFDDVLSTGVTYEAAKKFLIEGCVVSELKSIFVFKEGTSYKDSDEISYLGVLPEPEKLDA